MTTPGSVGRHAEHGAAADLAVFVDRLAVGGSDQPTAVARTQIRRAIGDGYLPPGLRLLADALVASVDRPPAPRRSPENHLPENYLAENRSAENSPAENRPVENRTARGDLAVVAAMRTAGLALLTDTDAEGAAAAIHALLANGKRVIVTGLDPLLTDAVRGALSESVGELVLGRPVPLSPPDLRDLRGLLATSTPGRRARIGQQLPARVEVPDPAEVDRLCRLIAGAPAIGCRSGMVPDLLAALDPTRRATVTSVAHLVDRSLSALSAAGDADWVWRLVGDLVLAQQRGIFDDLLMDLAQAIAAVERSHGGAEVSFIDRPIDGTLALLRQYRDHLAAGGRARTYFRSMLQREAEPALALIRVAGRVPARVEEVARVVEHMELSELLRRVCLGCTELNVPPPGDDEELYHLNDLLLRVAAAVRAVGVLRHDVLFLAPDSPLAVPDLAAAAGIAEEVLDYEAFTLATEAVERLDRLTLRLVDATRGWTAQAAPEHERALAALRARDAVAYAAAVADLNAARREQDDEHRATELLDRLAAGAPRLAAAWAARVAQDSSATSPDTGTAATESADKELADDERPAGGFGLAVFRPLPDLLTELPQPDAADLVLVLGAAELGVEHLLVTAVAPRLIAVVGPGESPGTPPSFLSVLSRADALVIQGSAVEPEPADVVPIAVGRLGRGPLLRRSG